MKTKGNVWPLMVKLGELKNSNKALNGGKNPASYDKINSSDNKNILIFSREKEGNKVTFMANLSNKEVTFKANTEGEFIDFFTNEKFAISKEKSMTFKPWEYKILID